MGIRADLRLLANIMDHAPVLICALDSQGYLQRVSGSCHQLLGRDCAELIGQAFGNILHPDDQAAVEVACRTARTQAAALQFENRCRHADGASAW